MKKKSKTNAARILDKLGISYELVEYEVDEEDLSAVHVAETTGMNVDMIFKTLVSRGDKTGVIFAVIPGALEVDLKLLATASSNKRVELVPLKELLPLTGYIRGGCSPIGAKKNYPVFIDSRAVSQEKISISAGKRGEQILIAPNDLIKATSAVVAEIAR